jgi:hypothetical protein
MPKGKKQKSKNNEPQEEEKKAPGKLKTCK